MNTDDKTLASFKAALGPAPQWSGRDFFPTPAAGEPRASGGGVGVPASGGTRERLGGFVDRPIKPGELP